MLPRAHALSNLLTQPPGRCIDAINMSEMFPDEQAMMGLDLACQGLLELLALGPEFAQSQLRQLSGVDLLLLQ